MHVMFFVATQHALLVRMSDIAVSLIYQVGPEDDKGSVSSSKVIGSSYLEDAIHESGTLNLEK